MISLGGLSYGVGEAGLEASPVLVHVVLTLGLGVNLDAVLSIGVLGVGEESNLKAAGGALVWHEFEAELSGVLLLHAISNRVGVLGVASAAAVVNEDVVWRCFAASEFLRRCRTHNKV